MAEKYPTWLHGHIKTCTTGRLLTITLCSITGNEQLEVWYCGNLLTIEGESKPFIVSCDDVPELVAAHDPISGEDFIIFDGGRHGYNSMFCDEYDPVKLKDRTLKKYDIPASKLILELGYSINYEDEKEEYETDEKDNVELIYGDKIPWEQVKQDGIDYIALFYINDKGKKIQILDAELA